MSGGFAHVVVFRLRATPLRWPVLGRRMCALEGVGVVLVSSVWHAGLSSADVDGLAASVGPEGCCLLTLHHMRCGAGGVVMRPAAE